MEKKSTDEEIVNILKSNGISCRSCWYQEGGLCYSEPCERHESGRSKKEASSVCSKHSGKRSMLEKVFQTNMLVIMSEEILRKEFKTDTLDDMKTEVEKFVKHYTGAIKSRIS